MVEKPPSHLLCISLTVHLGEVKGCRLGGGETPPFHGCAVLLQAMGAREWDALA